MSARPSEIKALADLLESNLFDTPEAAAKACILALEESRVDRVEVVCICVLDGHPYVYGPWPTFNKATEAVEKGRVPMAPVAETTVLAKLRSAAYAARSIESL